MKRAAHVVGLVLIALLVGLFLQPGIGQSQDAAATASGPKDVTKGMTSLFDGRSLNGWIQEPEMPANISGGEIADLPSLAKKLADKSDALSAYLSDRLDDAAKAALAAYKPDDDASTRALRRELSRSLNQVIAGPSLHDEARFKNVKLGDEAEQSRKKNLEGKALARLNRALLEDAYPQELKKVPATSWIVKDGAMVSTGGPRGVLYTKDDYGKFRLIFTFRHVSGQPDHRACILIFCTRPGEGERPADALAGIQFQPPNGGSWDYRKGKNNAGKGLFTRPDPRPRFDEHEWSRVEILADATTGKARMAVSQPIGAPAVEVLSFDDPTAGKLGPIAWQIHNAGLFDEFKDVWIEVDPKEDRLITVK